MNPDASPVVGLSDVLADIAAHDAPTLDTAIGAALDSPTLAPAMTDAIASMPPASDVNAAPSAPTDAPSAPAPVATPATSARRSPTVAAFLAGDLTPRPPADTSIGATLRACGIDAAAVTVPGTSGIVNVTPASHHHDGAALDPSALDTRSLPVLRGAPALRLAHAFTSAAVALLTANPTHKLTNADASPFRVPADVHALATAIRALYFRAMIVHPSCPANFRGNRVSHLDVIASLARAAARLAGDDLPAVANGPACRLSVPALHASLAARVANLNA